MSKPLNVTAINSKEAISWIIEHVQLQGHTVDSIKGMVNGSEINVGFIDTVTNETVYLNWAEKVNG